MEIKKKVSKTIRPFYLSMDYSQRGHRRKATEPKPGLADAVRRAK